MGAFNQMHYRLVEWAAQINSYLLHVLFPVQSDQILDLSPLNDSNIFVPVLPLFESPSVVRDLYALCAANTLYFDYIG